MLHNNSMIIMIQMRIRGKKVKTKVKKNILYRIGYLNKLERKLSN